MTPFPKLYYEPSCSLFFLIKNDNFGEKGNKNSKLLC